MSEQAPQEVLKQWLGVPDWPAGDRVREAIRAVLARLERAETEIVFLLGAAKETEAERDELREAGIAENHAIMTLTGPPREGYTLQQEIRAQLEETQAERDELRAEEERLRTVLDMDCDAIALYEATERVDKAEAALAAVLAIHREYRIYDECGHDHQEGEPGVIDTEAVGLTCEAGYLYSVCYACETDDGLCREDTHEHPYPCATVRAAAEKHYARSEKPQETLEKWLEAERDELRRSNDRLLVAITKMESERDALRAEVERLNARQSEESCSCDTYRTDELAAGEMCAKCSRGSKGQP